jgi:hypothetical protein
LLAGTVLALASCGGGDALRWDAEGLAASMEASPAEIVLVNSNLGAGVNRLALGLVSQGGAVGTAQVSVQLYRLGENPDDDPETAELRSEHQLALRRLIPSTDHEHADGSVHRHDGPPAAMYVADVDFTEVGWWGIAIAVEFDGRRSEGMLVRSFIPPRTSEPSIGDPAPRSAQRTIADTPLESIDSTLPPNPGLHDQTVAAALDTGRPVVVAFASPSFCESRFCGPVVEEVLVPASQQYEGSAEFVHIEPWDLEQARTGTLVPEPVTDDWGLISEPWIFVVGTDGRIAAKFEGIVELKELTAVLDALLSDS